MTKTLLLAAVFSFSAFAGSTEFVPLQERAQGRSLAGAQLLNDSLFSNPASAAFTQVYSVDGSMRSLKDFAISILDTKTSTLGGTIGYYQMQRSDTLIPTRGAKLGLTSRLSQTFGLGLAAKMIWAPSLTGGPYKYTDADLGLIANFDFLQFGLSIQNLFGGEELLGETREYSFGGRIDWENTVFFSAAVTGHFAGLQPTEVGFGAEYVSPYMFGLKGGFRTLTTQSGSFWSLGASVNSPKVSLHYALEIPNQDGSLEHMFGTTVLF